MPDYTDIYGRFTEVRVQFRFFKAAAWLNIIFPFQLLCREHALYKRCISKFLADTHMILECALSIFVVFHLFVLSAASYASLSTIYGCCDFRAGPDTVYAHIKMCISKFSAGTHMILKSALGMPVSVVFHSFMPSESTYASLFVKYGHVRVWSQELGL